MVTCGDTILIGLSQARNIVKCTFGRLKAYWRCPTARLAMAKENITTVIAICAVLHSIYTDKGYVLPEDPAVWRLLVIPPKEMDIQPSTGTKR